MEISLAEARSTFERNRDLLDQGLLSKQADLESETKFRQARAAHEGSGQVDDDEMRRDNAKVYIPLTTAQKYFTGTAAVNAYAFKVNDPEALALAQKEAEALLRRSHRGISDFTVENIGEEILRIRKEVDKLIANWQVVLASIAGISLLVGGIGIFSVMQISISERVYEIGLRKASRLHPVEAIRAA